MVSRPAGWLADEARGEEPAEAAEATEDPPTDEPAPEDEEE